MMFAEEKYIERTFGFCEITWDIENFCLVPAREEWTFNSPDFYVRGPELTKWRMIIKRKPADESNYDITFTLKRLECDSYYEEVEAEFHVKCFTFGDTEDSSIDPFRDRGLFDVNAERSKDVGPAALCCCRDGSSNIYRTRCDILVTFQNNEASFPSCGNPEIAFQGEQLFYLYRYGKSSDCTLSLGDKNFNVHKIVMYHRIKNAELRDSILNETAVVNYAGEDVDKLYKFLYSGDLTYAVENPNISMYKMALDFGVQPIIDYYKPDKLELFTVCHAELGRSWSIINFFTCTKPPIRLEMPEENEFSWTIPNYFNRSSEALYSPYLTNGNKNIKWRWRVEPKVVGQGKTHPYVVLEIETGIKALCCNISFSSSGKAFYGAHEVMRKNEKVFPCEAIFPHDDFENYLEDGNLTIFFRLRFLTSLNYKESIEIGKETVTSNQLTVESIYNQFYEDLKRMSKDFEHTPSVSKNIAEGFGAHIMTVPASF